MGECKTCDNARKVFVQTNYGLKRIDCPDCIKSPLDQCKAKIDAALKELNGYLSLSIDSSGMAHVDLSYGGNYTRLMSLYVDGAREGNTCWQSYSGVTDETT